MRVIKRYANRKMYDTRTSKYVKLDAVAELVRAGEDLRIVDNDSGEDLTAVTFAQIIFEEQKRQNPLLGVPVLRWIIQQGGDALHDIMTGVERGREALEEFAQRGIKQISHAAEPKAANKPAHKGILDDLLEGPQKQIEQIQQRIDAQVRASIERVAKHPAIQGEIKRLESNMRSIEARLRKLPGLQGKPPKKRPERRSRRTPRA